MRELLFETSLNVVHCIRENKYDKLEEQNCLQKCSKEFIVNMIEEYGGILDTVQKEEYLKYFQYVNIRDSDKYMTYLDLFINGKRSDLTLICEIEILEGRVVNIVVEDVHVL